MKNIYHHFERNLYEKLKKKKKKKRKRTEKTL